MITFLHRNKEDTKLTAQWHQLELKHPKAVQLAQDAAIKATQQRTWHQSKSDKDQSKRYENTVDRSEYSLLEQEGQKEHHGQEYKCRYPIQYESEENARRGNNETGAYQPAETVNQRYPHYEEEIYTRTSHNRNEQHQNEYYAPPVERWEYREPIIRERRIPEGSLEDRIFDRLQKWSVTFSGRGDPIDFLDKVKEFVHVQRLPLDKIPFFLAEKLKGTALAWWKNRRQEWNNRNSFRRSLTGIFPTNAF